MSVRSVNFDRGDAYAVNIGDGFFARKVVHAAQPHKDTSEMIKSVREDLFSALCGLYKTSADLEGKDSAAYRRVLSVIKRLKVRFEASSLKESISDYIDTDFLGRALDDPKRYIEMLALEASSDRISNEGTPLILMHYSELRDMALESGSRFSRRHSQYVRL